MVITTDILKQIAPGSKKTGYKYLAGLALWMNNWFPKFEIDTKGELCHILAQLAHESDSFNVLEEYASGQAYEGRADLGNTFKGDGIKFKGRGPIQITGRTNYKLMGVKLGAPNKFMDNPSLLATPEWGVWSAATFWTEKGLLDISNLPDDTKIWVKKLNKNLSPFEYITWRVNGGFTHINERLKFYERAVLVL